MRLFRAGFTLVELTIVLVILSIILLVVAPFLASSVSRNSLKNTTWEIVDNLRRAQTQAKAGTANSSWGVHFASNQYVFFQGSTYNAGDTNNIVTSVTGTISINSISLNAGSVDVRFTNKKGETSDFGTIQITDSNTAQTATITISAVGLIASTI